MPYRPAPINCDGKPYKAHWKKDSRGRWKPYFRPKNKKELEAEGLTETSFDLPADIKARKERENMAIPTEEVARTINWTDLMKDCPTVFDMFQKRVNPGLFHDMMMQRPDVSVTHKPSTHRFEMKVLDPTSDGVHPTYLAKVEFDEAYLSMRAGKEERMLLKDNPTSSQSLPTIMGQKLYAGPAVEVKVHQGPMDWDVEVEIFQRRVMTERTIKFGPLSTTLSELFRKGHWLEVRFDHRLIKSFGARTAKVYLTDGTDRYKVYSIDWHELQAMGKTHGQYDLGSAVPNETNLLRTHSSARYPKPVIQERVVEKIVERDPWEMLGAMYPRRGKKKLTMDTMVGNRTLGERLYDHF